MPTWHGGVIVHLAILQGGVRTQKRVGTTALGAPLSANFTPARAKPKEVITYLI